MQNQEKTMEKIVALCKGRGFIYPGTEIYGGLANPGTTVLWALSSRTTLKTHGGKNSSRSQSPYNVGVDAAILMNPRFGWRRDTWADFPTLLWTARECKARFRADKLIEDFFSAAKTAVTAGQRQNDRVHKRNTTFPAPSAESTTSPNHAS